MPGRGQKTWQALKKSLRGNIPDDPWDYSDLAALRRERDAEELLNAARYANAWRIRRAAADALIRIDAYDEAELAISDALNDGNKRLRRAIVLLLSKMPIDHRERLIAHALKDGDGKVRDHAIWLATHRA